MRGRTKQMKRSLRTMTFLLALVLMTVVPVISLAENVNRGGGNSYPYHQ